MTRRRVLTGSDGRGPTARFDGLPGGSQLGVDVEVSGMGIFGWELGTQDTKRVVTDGNGCQALDDGK